jgi:two-component system, NarL family, response regulator DevR
MLVLIVEDQLPMQNALVDFVRARYPGAVALGALGVVQGLKLCLRDEPDLVLTDVALPDGNGIIMAAEIRDRLPEIPVIIVSQYTASSYIEHAKTAGAHAYVSKDSIHRDLQPAIDSALARLGSRA